MPDRYDKETRKAKQFELALDARKYEIDKFWSRAAFFWAFTIAVAGGLGFSLKEAANIQLSVVLGCLGFIVSLCWSLAGRGSKYWQESWEEYVGNLEQELLETNMFSVPKDNPSKSTRFGAFDAQRFSVSRLAIAVSDAVTVAWLGTLIAIVPLFPRHENLFAVAAMLITLLIALYIVRASRSRTPTGVP